MDITRPVKACTRYVLTISAPLFDPMRPPLALPFVGCHPCVNTASLKLKTEDVFGTFARATGHDYRVVHLIGE